MRKNTGDLPLTGQGRIASGGTYSCYGYPNMENIKRATQEFLDGLERDGTLEPALERLRTAKEEKKSSAGTDDSKRNLNQNFTSIIT